MVDGAVDDVVDVVGMVEEKGAGLEGEVRRLLRAKREAVLGWRARGEEAEARESWRASSYSRASLRAVSVRRTMGDILDAARTCARTPLSCEWPLIRVYVCVWVWWVGVEMSDSCWDSWESVSEQSFVESGRDRRAARCMMVHDGDERNDWYER